MASRRALADLSSAGTRKRRRWQVANICFAAFLALALIGVAPFQEWVMPARTGSGDIANQILYLGIFLFLLLGSGPLVTRRQLLPLPLSIALLLAYCLISVLWALDPAISLRRLILAAVVIWVIFRCVGDLGYARTLLIAEYALIALLLVNYLLVFLTDYGVHPAVPGEESSIVGNWRGILPHKNIAGATCAFTVLFMLFDATRIPKYLRALTIVAALVFLYFTQSKTSEAVLVAAIAAGLLIRPYHASYRTFAAVGALIMAIIAVQLLSVYSEALRTIINDPTALTGRASIWPLLLDYAGDHLWTGAGFGSFWQIGEASPIWALTHGWVAQYASHGHNGYLDLLVTIGLPGLVLAVIALLVWPLARLLLSLSITRGQRSLLLALFVFCACHNLTESSLMNGASTVQIFFVMTIALIYYLSSAGSGAHQPLRRRALRILRLDRSRTLRSGRVAMTMPAQASYRPIRKERDAHPPG
ncbi:hypothetical protein BH10PSE14_BH10PSE14_31490 [soil metagenome]